MRRCAKGLVRSRRPSWPIDDGLKLGKQGVYNTHCQTAGALAHHSGARGNMKHCPLWSVAAINQELITSSAVQTMMSQAGKLMQVTRITAALEPTSDVNRACIQKKTSSFGSVLVSPSNQQNLVLGAQRVQEAWSPLYTPDEKKKISICINRVRTRGATTGGSRIACQQETKKRRNLENTAETLKTHKN